MTLRAWAEQFAGGAVSDAVAALNARHPWSHNDHFHSWILANLPARRDTALDVGCGQGGLLAALAPRFTTVHGTDRDGAMRGRAATRCASLPNVIIHDATWVDGPVDLVTMVAVLHHLDVADALEQVRDILQPGGRFLAVGLAPPQALSDHLWDLASMVTNPAIGYVKHPWPSADGASPPAFPVKEPTMSYAELRDVLADVMPGASIRHRLGFRHTIAWTKPA